MILFFIPNKDDISDIVEKSVKKYALGRYGDKRYFMSSSALKYYPKISRNKIIVINNFLDFLKNFFYIFSLKNKVKSYLFLTGSPNSIIWIKFLGILSSWERKIINENKDSFNSFNFIVWLKYFKWRIKKASSISLRNPYIFLIPAAVFFVTIRLLLFYINYKFKDKNKL